MTEVMRCCSCKQPIIPKPIRTCWDCGAVMPRHDKWTLQDRQVAEGVVVAVMVHRCCENPTAAMPIDEYLKGEHHPYRHASAEQKQKVRDMEAANRERIEQWRRDNGRELK